MAFPLLPIAMIMAGGSGIMNYFNEMALGDAERQMSDYEAAQLEANSRAVRRRAQSEEKRLRRESEAFKSTQRAVRGASGVTVEGSPLEVMGETAKLTELDALAIRLQGGYEAANYRSQAALTRMGGRMRRAGRRIGAFSSLLSAGGSLAALGLRIPGSSSSGGGGGKGGGGNTLYFKPNTSARAYPRSGPNSIWGEYA